MGKEKSKKRKRSASATADDSDSGREKKKLRKLKKKLKKEQKRTEKALKKKLKEKRKKKTNRSKSRSEERNGEKEEETSDIPIELMEKSKAMAPMTKEEWEKRQSIIRKVLDEETGRYRLIKGDGEVLETMVSREQHKQINRTATQADGAFFQSQTIDKKRL